MLFYLAFINIATACSTITIRTLIGYSDMKLMYKIAVGVAVVLGWFGILILRLLKLIPNLNTEFYSVTSSVLYALMGFMFILFIIIMLRDIVWYLIFYSLKLFKIDAWYLDPRNLSILNIANLIVILIAFSVSMYASYEGNKIPDVIKETIQSSKISRSLRIVQVSDLHITRATSNNKIIKIINVINSQNPDIIVLTGDTIDDDISSIEEKLNLLSSLSAPYGVYAIIGNHEFYNDVYAFKRAIENIDIKFLFNSGVHIENSNIYLAGLPEFSTMFERINLWRSIQNSQKSDFKILLSHQPVIINSLDKELYDLVLSGHTHGGQIFPMHLLTKKANQYLAGRYKANGIDLIVSRGAGAWGPQMRLFAPSDIVVIDLLKK